MFSTEEGIPLCVIKEGKSDKEILYLSDKEIDLSPSNMLSHPQIAEISNEGKFELIPNERVRVSYIAGPSGSGKSTLVAKYVKHFQNLFPNNKIILFSRIKDDPAFKDLSIRRVILTNDLISSPIQLEECTAGSLVIFDDIDTISSKKLLESILNFQAQLLEMGRHRSIFVIVTSHLINGHNRDQTRTIINEMQSVTFFPQNGSTRQIKYLLMEYFGLSYKQVGQVLKIPSRWITLLTAAPQILISERKAIFMSLYK